MSGRTAPRDARHPRKMDPGYDEPPPGRRLSPGPIFLVVAIVGSIAYMAYTVTVREASQIPLLASGAVVLAIVFGALSGYCLRATWRAGEEDRGRRALLIGLLGGGAAMAAAGFAAAAIILFQVAAGAG